MTANIANKGIVAIGCDHAGYAVKVRLKTALALVGAYTICDFGVDSEDSADYPDYARLVVEAVRNGRAGWGILSCGTGLGMSYAANRYPGIRAAVCWSAEVARLARDHNDANILIVPGRVATLDPAEEILAAWLETSFSGETRHLRRIRKLDEEERRGKEG
ncbi:MAG: ribose 5-phosphate isomerase B [Planctomycetota bacterium]|nr:ribose 5-phosphate isomerase B [Planctomycetota bacterium]